jgi:tetratricopeptide (TPR) repeat protein
MDKNSLKFFFKKEPVAVKINSKPGGIDNAMPELLAALGLALPNDAAPRIDIDDKPVEELTLEITQPFLQTKDNKTRASATARLIYNPASGAPDVQSDFFTFTSPTGPIEIEDTRWYLEEYFLWPHGVFQKRAEEIEKKFPQWGLALYKAFARNEGMIQHWINSGDGAHLRLTVFVEPKAFDHRLSEEEAQKRQAEADEASTLILGLPWELLHDCNGYLFKGARPVFIRRRLPNRLNLNVIVSDPPVRILLVSPRPEEKGVGYIDHRVSATPLVEATENLGDMVQLTILSPPTFKAMDEELTKARQRNAPYHVVHFDGHGVFDKLKGLGALCFESPGQDRVLELRTTEIIHAEKLAETIRSHRIPLFFLEACQSAKMENNPTASVATKLLDQGVASVVAMSHFVLVQTARRFVDSFYRAIATGSTVGRAMVQARVSLKHDSWRGVVKGAGTLRLEDWFVPVLFQEQNDVQLFKRIPSERIHALNREALNQRLGELPPQPDHRFVGRSRMLLAIERLLVNEPYASIHGQGGEGKTTLAVELARWLVRSNRFDRAVFVSVEFCKDLPSVVDCVGRQLVPGFSAGTFKREDLLTKAFQPIERALGDFRVVIVFDNMETILPSDALDYDPIVFENLTPIFHKLLKSSRARLLFTSREAMPAPFDQNKFFLSHLSQHEAIELLQNVMERYGVKPKQAEHEEKPDLEALVDAVNCHARSLALLGDAISRYGVEGTTKRLRELMVEMETRSPGNREKSLFASVELSLRRLNRQTREKLRGLAVFHSGFHPGVLDETIQIDINEAYTLGQVLVGIGLAQEKEYRYFSLHPALCPYLDLELDPEQRQIFRNRWAEGMKGFIGFLYEQQFQDARVAAVLTLHDLPNLMALLNFLTAQGDGEETALFAGRLEDLLCTLGRPHILARVAEVRQREAKELKQWSNTAFNATIKHIHRLLERGAFQKACADAEGLLQKSLSAGQSAYPGADYDIAIAYLMLGRALKNSGDSYKAIGKIEEAYQRFHVMGEKGNKSAARMASGSLTEKGDCLLNLGRLDEAASAYQEGIKISESLNDIRGAAVGRGQLGTVRMVQGRHQEALDAYQTALKDFEALQEPGAVATSQHQIGMVYEASGDFNMAESAYKKSLGICVLQKDEAGQASTLTQLGNLCNKMGRLEDAAVFYSQAADKFVKLKDIAHEGFARNNLANTLIKLKRYIEARKELQRAIECKKPFGHASEPWKTYSVLKDLETAEGNSEAAAQARSQAIALYLSYRRDGGENHSGGGRLCHDFRQMVAENKIDELKGVLAEIAGDAEYGVSMRKLARALDGILRGVRDKSVAEDMEMSYDDAAEVLLMLGDV